MQVCSLFQTDNHASTSPLSFLQAGCPSCRPANSVKALKANRDKLDVAENSFLQAQLSKHTVFVGIITKKVTILLSIC